MQQKQAPQSRWQRTVNHFQYFWWLYVLIVVGSVFVWDLLYTTTEPKAPEDKRFDLYVQSVYANDEQLKAFFQQAAAQAAPEVEEVSVVVLSMGGDIYGNMQLTVYLVAREGDIYLLGKDDFKSFASQGIFVDLDPLVQSGEIHLQGYDLRNGYVRTVDSDGNYSENLGLYGIPLAELKGLDELLGMDTTDLYLCVTVYNGNDDNVHALLNEIIRQCGGNGQANGE